MNCLILLILLLCCGNNDIGWGNNSGCGNDTGCGNNSGWGDNSGCRNNNTCGCSTPDNNQGTGGRSRGPEQRYDGRQMMNESYVDDGRRDRDRGFNSFPSPGNTCGCEE